MNCLLALMLVLLVTPAMATERVLDSPNGKVRITLDFDSGENPGNSDIQYSVSYLDGEKYVEVLPPSSMGLVVKDKNFSSRLKFVSESGIKSIDEKYTLPRGKRKNRENHGRENRFTFANDNNETLTLILRAYNDGIAFKYSVDGKAGAPINVLGELTSYTIPEGTNRWIQQYDVSYERFYPLRTTGQGEGDPAAQEWGYPALFEAKAGIFALISEANVGREHVASRLSNEANHEQYKLMYPPARKRKPALGVHSTLPWSSPWRVVIIGHLGDIVASTLITDLSDPTRYTSTDWIKPGVASWVYWANNHGSKDYKKLKEYVDLAAAMKWPYTVIDWEWDAMTNGGTIEDITRYANSKGVKPMLWFNSGSIWLDPTPVDNVLTAESRAKTFAWLNKIGVYGIKVDFFAGDQQDMMNYYIDILEDAAKYKLMVNFHGATIPRGWQRTYPNMMSVEGVYGAEWYNNGPDLTKRAAAHNATLPFTRNVVGPMDYTPVTFTNSQNPHITSYAHELALSVVFESSLQHFADRPSGYYSLPKAAQKFLQQVPVTWDDTVLIDGYPGKFVILARRKAQKWYIAGINGTDEAKILNFSLPFLTKGKHRIELIKDGKDDKSFAVEKSKIDESSKLQIHALARGGFVAVVE